MLKIKKYKKQSRLYEENDHIQYLKKRRAS